MNFVAFPKARDEFFDPQWVSTMVTGPSVILRMRSFAMKSFENGLDSKHIWGFLILTSIVVPIYPSGKR